MGNGNAAKLHHYVPQGYLRGFATQQDRITAVPLDRSRAPFTTVVKNVAAQTHFHTVPGAEEPDGFERILSSVEGAAIEIVRRMERGSSHLDRRTESRCPFIWRFRRYGGPIPGGRWNTCRRRWCASK